MQCRACMQVDECGEVVDMSSVAPGDTKTFYDYFNDCTQLQANSMDKLPQMLCSNCSQILRVAYDFIREARQSDEQLKKLLEVPEIEEDMIYCNSEQTTSVEYDPLIAIDNSPEKIGESSQIKQSINSLEVNSEGDENELVESFVCSICSSKFILNKTYRLHMKKVHNQTIGSCSDVDENEKNVYECEICNSIFKHRFAVWSHKKRLHPPIPAAYASKVTEGSENSIYYKECRLCTCNFISKQAYRSHMTKVHAQNDSDEENLYECDICKLQFKYRTSVYMHKKRKHSEMLNKSAKDKNIILDAEEEVAEEDESSFSESKHCNTQLSKEQNETHEAKHGSDQSRKRFLCASCPREYKYYPSLCKHMKVCHSKDNPAPLDCPICKKKFRNLKLHMKNIHLSVGEYICSLCGNSYKNSVQLYNHKRLHMERKIACSLCEKKFVRSSDLRRHQRYHSGEEPYACHLCDRTFKISTKLKYHLQRHAGIKHKCKVCGDAFNDARQLHIHSFKHTGMPYKCPICEYGCVKRGVFRTHLLRMHNMTMTNDEYCSMFKANTGRHPRVKPIAELTLEEL